MSGKFKEMKMAKEFEVKIFDIDKNLIRNKLIDLNFNCSQKESLMVSYNYIPVGLNPSEKVGRKWIRIRSAFGKNIMTLKEIKSEEVGGVHEWEVVVDNFQQAKDMIENINFKFFDCFEKYREIWESSDGTVEVMIDTCPGINPLIEIEGKNKKVVLEVVDKLGYHLNDSFVNPSLFSAYEKEFGMTEDEYHECNDFSFENPKFKKY